MRTLPLVSLCLATTALAAGTPVAPLTVPLVISHAGRLLDGADKPVNGQVQLTFTIYEDGAPPTNGTDKTFWSAQYDVTVTDGVYALALGDPKAGAALPASVFQSADNRWLGIAIAGEELLPRLRLGVTPFAVAAMNADQLNGLDSSAFAPAAIVDTVNGIDANVNAIKTAVGATAGSDIGAIKAAVGATAGADIGAVKAALGATAGSDIGSIKTALGATAGADVASIKSSVGATVGADVGAIKAAVGATAGADLAAVKAAVGTSVGSDVTTIKGAVGATVGADVTTASAKLDRLLARAAYSVTCKDSFVASAWGDTADTSGFNNCLHDGRWHMVTDVSSGTPVGLTGAQLKALNDTGGTFRVTTASLVSQGFDCVRVEYRPVAGRLICVGPMHAHPGSAFGPEAPSPTNFHLISFNVDSDGRVWHSPYITTPGYGASVVGYGPSCSGCDVNTWGKDWFGPPSAIQAKWWVRF